MGVLPEKSSGAGGSVAAAVRRRQSEERHLSVPSRFGLSQERRRTGGTTGPGASAAAGSRIRRRGRGEKTYSRPSRLTPLLNCNGAPGTVGADAVRETAVSDGNSANPSARVRYRRAISAARLAVALPWQPCHASPDLESAVIRFWSQRPLEHCQ